MTMPEITMGITKTPRSAVLKRILLLRPIASTSEITFTRITVTTAKNIVKA
jgi:hypothetical protein